MRKRDLHSPQENFNQEEKLKPKHCLILYNDDYNDYEFVIDSLVEVCQHNRLQAEQCTLIAHHNGKCDVKIGELSELLQMQELLLNKGLAATIVS